MKKSLLCGLAIVVVLLSSCSQFTSIKQPQESASDSWTVQQPNQKTQPEKKQSTESMSTEEINENAISIYLVAIDDNGKSGPPIGCGDSLIAAQVKYGIVKDQSTAIDALTKLFAVKQQYYGESGLYNSLYQSDLKVDSLVTDSNKKATLKLSGQMALGGVCDNPRFEEQIRATVLQFKNLYTDVDIYLNNKPLKELLSEA